MSAGPNGAEERRRLLVTHADQPLGRRIVERLFRDRRVGKILAIGEGPPPRSFDHLLAARGRRLDYARCDLSRHRPVTELFHSERVRRQGIDGVIHVPTHGPVESPERPVVGGIATRTAEARLVLQNCLQTRGIRDLIALGSAFVYRLPPGNANRLTEGSELNLDPGAPPDLRSWVDCDMIFHGEIHGEGLRVVLLRVPSVVGAGGVVFFNPMLVPRRDRVVPDLRPLGYDPLCALVSDEDVALAVQRSVHSHRAGVYNVAGRETLPLSALTRFSGHSSVSVPRGLLGLTSRVSGLVAGGWRRISLDGPEQRFGFTLDTRCAERDLGFRPSQRIGLVRGPDGRIQIDAAPV